MLVMAEEKRSPGRPKGRTPKYTVHTAIEPEIGLELEAFMAEQEFEPKLKDVVERALVEFLERRGRTVELKSKSPPKQKPKKS